MSDSPTDGATWTIHVLSEVSGEPAFDGPDQEALHFDADVELQLIGETPEWARVSILRHAAPLPPPVETPAARGAADPGRLVLQCQRRPDPMAGLTLPDWSSVDHPPTEDDPPIAILHILRFADRERSLGEMARYHDAAVAHAVPRGARTLAWFDVTATLEGDGRRWEQVRLNAFPSRAALMEWALDPERISANEDREQAIADTYALLLAPRRNLLGHDQPHA